MQSRSPGTMVLKDRPADFSPKVEVSGCFLQYEGKILLLLRQDHKPEGNTWSVPAGKVDPGESPLEAIIREVREETGYSGEPKNYRKVGTFYVRCPERDFIYHTFHLALESLPEVILEDSAHKEFRWMTPEEALALPLIHGEDVCIKDFYNL